MKKAAFGILVAVAFVLSGCATMEPKYTYVVDQDKVTQADNLKRQQRQVAHVVWVNPPMKKVALDNPPK